MTFEHPGPLIVCGFGRSGTRMCANLLANAQTIELQGEIPRDLSRPTLDWLVEARRLAPPDQPERIYGLVRAVFRDITPSRPITRPDPRWFGHKTPHHERWFDAYETIMDHPSARPVYVYCLRNPAHVWRSYRVMPWGGFDTVRAFVKSWLRSLDAFERMRAAAPERVILFNLDVMLRAPDREAWLQHALFDRLGVTPAMFRKPLDQIGNTNSAQAKLGAPPPEIPFDDLRVIARNADVRNAVREHFPWLDEELETAAGSARGLLSLIRPRTSEE